MRWLFAWKLRSLRTAAIGFFSKFQRILRKNFTTFRWIIAEKCLFPSKPSYSPVSLPITFNFQHIYHNFFSFFRNFPNYVWKLVFFCVIYHSKSARKYSTENVKVFSPSQYSAWINFMILLLIWTTKIWVKLW